MNRTTRITLVAAAMIGVAAGSYSLAHMQQPAEPPAAGEFQLPPGWTMEDAMACAEAGAPGPMHERLAKSVGEWTGKTTMWMAPGVEPIVSESSSTITSIMGGRFIKLDVKGNWPGMGPFTGMGIYGYDNVVEQFQVVWIDSAGTGMTIGTGELSSDDSTLTWKSTYHCPLTKKPTTFREIHRTTGENTATLEMFGVCPKTGVEYKMMEIDLTRKTTSRSIGRAN